MKTDLRQDDGRDPIRELGDIVAQKKELARREAAAVRSARTAGMSWAGIATVLGISRQAAHRKYGKKVGTRDTLRRRPGG
ncbi:AsnC family protein [Glutamicibacter sp. V16R2B1]|uniref:AsnC family protein n=1 Tax=Glutamicibacter sp. V16R2B1 TaxID=2036207 RepID=UPI0010FD1C61|nr:AsnC family protein [Glutamicibacter sp. V16R2B1]TLK56572.1 AsnC family protein [Glutamicibacter sp. V16R2B1]